MAYGKDVSGSKIQTGCRSLSGTSVASPVVAGAVCLLASVIPKDDRWRLLNPASMKQALVEGADRLQGPHMFEQGQGRINLVKSMVRDLSVTDPSDSAHDRVCRVWLTHPAPLDPLAAAHMQGILKAYKPRASVVPAEIDLSSCPYMWPLCRQPLYASALPVGLLSRLDSLPYNLQWQMCPCSSLHNGCLPGQRIVILTSNDVVPSAAGDAESDCPERHGCYRNLLCGAEMDTWAIF